MIDGMVVGGWLVHAIAFVVIAGPTIAVKWAAVQCIDAALMDER